MGYVSPLEGIGCIYVKFPEGSGGINEGQGRGGWPVTPVKPPRFDAFGNDCERPVVVVVGHHEFQQGTRDPGK